MPDVRWIKVVTDIFDDEKIILIEQMPGSSGILLTWFKMLCFAGKQNNGGVFTVAGVPHTARTLSAIFRMKEAEVQRALSIFEQFGMIETVDGVITIVNWEKHQNLEGMEKIREQNKMRKQRQRMKEKCQIAEEPNTTAQQTSAEINGENEMESEYSVEILSVINYLNEKAGTNFRCNTEPTRRLICARMREGFTEENFRTVIENQCKEWMSNPDMRKYLRPQTLFGEKFESYLQSANKKPPSGCPENSSFDTDEFMMAALKRTYGETSHETAG